MYPLTKFLLKDLTFEWPIGQVSKTEFWCNVVYIVTILNIDK